MSITGKPKNLDEFLGSAPAEQAPPEPSAARPAARITKTIRMSPEMEEALKDAAYSRSKAAGRRVTESDLIEDALKKYFNM
jgi:hypothetical protein